VDIGDGLVVTGGVSSDMPSGMDPAKAAILRGYALEKASERMADTARGGLAMHTATMVSGADIVMESAVDQAMAAHQAATLDMLESRGGPAA
jgi:hypothetical protein